VHIKTLVYVKATQASRAHPTRPLSSMQNHAPPLVTAGVTCHNAEATIARAVRSAARQTWPNLEIVAVDDASSDRSRDILQKLADQDGRLRVIALDRNVGVAAARNRIIQAARGEFLAFFDDDDESSPDRIADQVARIEAYEADTGASAVICHAARRIHDSTGVSDVIGPIGADMTPAPQGLEVFDFIMTGKGARRLSGAGATCSQMARTSVYRKLGGFDRSFRRMEDTDLNLRAALAGAHFPGLSKALVVQTPTRGDEKAPEAERDAMLALLDRHGQHPRVVHWQRFNRRWCALKYARDIQDRGTAGRLLFMLALRHPIQLALRLLCSRITRRTRRALAAAQARAVGQSAAIRMDRSPDNSG
jgi:GT2 family glycosyltransferase